MVLESSSVPNFIVGGTAAGGTSFLSAVLVQHPEVYLPKEMRPEPHFFYKSWEFEKGMAHYLNRWFAAVPSKCLAIGERSSSYLFGGRPVAEKIAAAFPKMKLIFTLRNPIERTWANYRYTALQGLEDLTFEDALAQESLRVANQAGIWAEIQPHNYTGRGYYAAQLKQFLEYFPRQQVLIIKSESLSKQTDVELRKIYYFLGLRDLAYQASRPPDHSSVNVVSPSIQMDLRKYFGERFDKVIEATRKGENLGAYVENKSDQLAINQLRGNMMGGKENMSPEVRAYLRKLFADDIEMLKTMVEFHVDDWS